MCRHYDYLIDTPRNELPHGGCDPPARIVSWYDLRHIIAPVTMAATGARATGGREGKAMGAQRMHAPTLPF